MEEMTKQEKCNFIKNAINALEIEKKEEVMKCVGQFVLNDKIVELNKQINHFQKQCPHDETIGKCPYCGKQSGNIR